MGKEKYEKLIVEYIWNPDQADKRYVLTIYQNDKCKVTDGFEFIDICLNLFDRKLGFVEHVQQLDTLIVGHEYLLNHSVQRVQLGVFNHWFSVGPIDLWGQGEELGKQQLLEKIDSRPEVKSSKLKYQALAFIFNFDKSLPGPYHVFKTPCCNKSDDGWRIDVELVWKTIKLLCNSRNLI